MDTKNSSNLRRRFTAWYSRFWDGVGSSYMEEKRVAIDPISSEWSREFLMRPVADALFLNGAYAKLNTVKALASLVLAACVAATVCVVAGAPVAVKLGAFGVAVLTAVGSWVMYGLGFDGEDAEMEAGVQIFGDNRDMRWLLDVAEDGIAPLVMNDSRTYGTPIYGRGRFESQWGQHLCKLLSWTVRAMSKREAR